MWSEQTYLLPLFIVTGYTAVFFAFMRAVNIWRDLFNPLCLILLIGFVRFSCPGFLLLNGTEPSEGIGLFYQLMQLSDREWQWGHALALTGLLAVVLGWILVPGRRVDGKCLNFYLTDGAKYAAFAGMLVGFMALSVFLVSNASLEVLESGAFRETTIQVGTGKYFFMAYMMMAGSVLFSCYLIARGYKWLALVPVTITTVAYWTLGGRGRALTSVAAGLLLLWYIGRENKRWDRVTFRPKYALVVSVGILFVVWFLYVGALYRGGLGLRALPESLSLSGLWKYIEGSIFTDVGQLHSLAGAFAIGPGVLGGQTFIGALTWPLEKFLPIPGKSAGVFIVQTLVGFSDEGKWGVHASLIGDAYLNFGLAGVSIVMVVLGVLLKFVYVKFREGSLQSVVYVLALLYGLQIFLVSIEVWPQTLTVLTFTLLLMLLGKTIFQVR